MVKKNSLNNKLDEILTNQHKILRNEQKLLGEEEKIEVLEEKEMKNEDKNQKTEEEALEELDNLEEELKKSISSPIKKISKRDIFKGFIGAFVGVISHFAFIKAYDIAPHLTFLRATSLYVVAFFIIIMMLYYTGFRNVEKRTVLKFMPIRATILFLVSILTAIIVNILFGKIYIDASFITYYKLVAANIILAVMGAGTADLIGRGE